jgi:hypothetical protein
MRHDGGNTLKEQGNLGELTALPLNAMECAGAKALGLLQKHLVADEAP